jgi:YD repeat-containing protein
MKYIVVISGLALVVQATGAQASTTTTYSYDALGRLVATSNTGTVNNGLTSATTYDKADNRSNYTIAGASKPDTKSAVVVVPLNGYTVIVTAPAVQ